MKREFLASLKLEDAVIDQIMAEHSKTVEKEQQKTATALQSVKELEGQLEKANKTLEGFKDYEETKAAVETYKKEAETAKTEAAAKIAALERSGQVKDFLSGKRFVNDITREALAAKLTEQLGSEEAKGKSLDDLFNALTKDKTNILVDENAAQPPTVQSMTGSREKESGVVEAFKHINPNIQLD